MSTKGQRGSVSPMLVDGISLDTLVENPSLTRSEAREDQHRYWSSAARPASSPLREIMEVSFGSPRLVNHLSFKVSRFPLVLTAEWLDEQGEWQPFTYAPVPTTLTAPLRRLPARPPVGAGISDSSPSVVRDPRTGANPFHSGAEHWQQESWKVSPVSTTKVRMVGVRTPFGNPPVDPLTREPVDYPIAISDLTIGYRVLSRHDVPSYDPGIWASSADLLGSRVGYSTYRQPPASAADDSTATYWRSEPQPFPFAVTGFHMDLRDDSGQPQVVDRFWVDPVTSGVLCNVYYSNDTDHEYFRGLSTPIPAADEVRYGLPTPPPPGSVRVAVEMDPEEKVGVAVSARHTRVDYSRAWWVGIDAHTLVPASTTGEWPLLSMGTTRVVQRDAQIVVVTSTGEEVWLPLDPALHTVGARFALLVSHHPASDGHRARIKITYRLAQHLPVTIVEDLLAPLGAESAPIGVGLHPDPADDGGSSLGIRGLVVKQETLDADAEDWFLDEGEAFVSDPLTPHDDRGTHFNALLRVHPDFVTDDNPFGIVGGTNDPFDQMTWTPIAGDYVLRQGYLNVPPTKAAFWKFEMTGLVPEVYENFVTMDREVLVYPQNVVEEWSRVAGAADDNSVPSGVGATAAMASSVQYSDVLDAIDRSQQGLGSQTDPTASTVLVVKDPLQAQRVATTGWVWTYQPWHSGSRAPRFSAEQVHHYERLRIQHSTKVAYFAAIREITPVRVDYAFPDDNPEYVERWLDGTFVDPEETRDVEFLPGGGVRSTSSIAEVTSVGMRSYRNVRGVQFASQESDMIQMLEDPDFISMTMRRWQAFGDAKVIRFGPRDVLVNRGWNPNTYGDLETLITSPTQYGELEDLTYSEMEGLGPTGEAEGGIRSMDYLPFGSGEIMARVHVSAPSDLTLPITVELVSSETDEVWASSRRLLKAGEAAVISVRAAGSGTMVNNTYGDLENLVTPPTQYEELEDFSYAQLESAEGRASSVYVRVCQHGEGTDSFRVHRIALYDSPIAWFFSNDDGASYWQAISVRNDPHSVLSFPEFFDTEDEDMGRMLRWKVRFYRTGAITSALHVRPWYGVRGRTVDRAHGLELLGPNRNLRDLLPPTHQHPMWQETFNPIEHVYVVQKPVWRNLMPYPSAEGPFSNDEWEPENIRVDVALDDMGTGIRAFEFTAGEES